MRLVLTRCEIRSWQRSDVRSLARHANSRKVWRNVRDQFPFPYTESDAEMWIRTARSLRPETAFAIAVDGEAVGAIGIELKEDIYRRTAEIGYWLGESCWGRGIATDAVQAFTEWAFANFDLCRIYAHVFEWNPGSARVLEKAGYELEARLRQAVFKDGHTIDALVYAVVRPPAAGAGDAPGAGDAS